MLSHLACVPVAQCGCKTEKGDYIPIGAKIESPDCTSVRACVAKGDRGTFVSFTRPVCGRNAVCKPVGGHYKCACKPGLTGDPLKECINPTCSCTASGDPHYRTFDGQIIHFFGACKYTVAAHDNSACRFAVEAKHEYRGGNNKVTFMRLVDLKFHGHVYRLHMDRKLYVDGIQKYPPYVDEGVVVYTSGQRLRLETSCGVVVEYDGIHIMEVIIPRKFGQQVTGICGNCNDKRDDLRTKDGTDVSTNKNKYSLIGNSYEVMDDSDLIIPQCKPAIDVYPCTDELLLKAKESLCRYIKLDTIDGKFKKCINADPERAMEMYDSCIIDYCAYYGRPNFHQVMCEGLEGFAEQCHIMGIPISWRDDKLCPLSCGQNSNYKPQISSCPATCLAPLLSNSCKQPPREGCECKAGYYMSNLECVPDTRCGCTTSYGEYVPVGATVENSDCTIARTCQLIDGKAKLVAKTLSPCAANGQCKPIDGHYKCICKPGFQGDPLAECTEVKLECGKAADIVFVLDSSSSMRSNNFAKIINFVKKLVSGFMSEHEQVRISVITFSHRSRIQFYLNRYTEPEDIINALSKIRHMRGGTRTDYALHDMHSKVLTEANGDRPGYPNIGIVITDGKSNYPKKTREEMIHMKEDGVMMFAIGIGSSINQEELETIAIEKDHALRVKGFDSLEHIMGEFQEITCRGIAHAPKPHFVGHHHPH
ncbi:zonadhesin-like [Mytilus trossulus]|uniref:zonadhesin-like n=1 Tax=Mytilus trossulus TaxID=6551 RepID=UPI003007D909